MAIYLIGGPPKCGKTTLAKSLAKELSIPWISADTLQNIAYAYSRKEEHKTLFPHSYLRGENNDEFYAAHSPEIIVQNYIEQGKATNKAIRMMVETYLADEDDFIIEGYQVTPEIVQEIKEEFRNEQIRSVFLVRNDEVKFLEDINKSTTPNDWILRRTKDKKTTLPKIARMVSIYSKYFEEEANKYHLPLFHMDMDFDGAMSTIIKSMRADD